MYKYVVHTGNNSRLFIKPLLDQRGNWVEASELEASDLKANFIWKPTVYHVRAYNQMDELFVNGFGLMIHNHLENNREITTKTGLIRSLRNFYQTNENAIMAGYQVHDTIPTSFIITAGIEDIECRSFHTRFNDIENGYCIKEKLPWKHCEKNMWLIKPAALNQGRGIEICRNIKEIDTILRGKIMHSVWLVQKYIEKPLLFKGRKFDIRVWAFATGKHDLFYYKHGYLRTSSSEYDTQAPDNFIHLTNNCLQKYGENYGIHEKGNTLSFQSFQTYLDETFPQYRLNFWVHFLPRIKDLIIDSYLSGKKSMHKGKRNKVFELFGYDFLIDEDFRVWLIEVNTNPYLGVPNEYIEKLLPIMLDDLLALCVDPYVPPKNPRQRKENDFELLYCEVASIYSPDGISKNYRQAYTTNIYPIPDLSPTPLSKVKPSEESIHMVLSEPPKPIVRDILQTVKEELENSIPQDISDFSLICNRVMSQLDNWELMSEEQTSAALQALQLLAGSNGVSAFVIYGHMPRILNLCVSENVPGFIQIEALEAVAIGCCDTKFRKEIVNIGICPYLIDYVLSEREEPLKNKALKVLIVISTHPTKKVYIPGHTQQHNWVRNRIITEGVLLCFYILGKYSAEVVKEKIKSHLQSEYNLSDWELQILTLNRFLLDSPKEIPKNYRANSLKSPPESGPIKEVDCKLSKVFNDKDFLVTIKNEIQEFCETKRQEIKARAEKDKIKKQENIEEKLRIQEQEDRSCEEKRQRAYEYANKRFEEIKKQKIEEIKRQKENYLQEEKFDEIKKAILIEKLKKTEEIKRIQRMKIKRQEEDIKRNEELKRKEIEEKRKKVMEDWLRNKTEKEKEKKMIEKQKKEEEQVKRNLEIQTKKEEFIQKIEERKNKIKKVKDDKRQKKNESQLNEESSTAMLEQEDVIRNTFINRIHLPLSINSRLKEAKQKKKKNIEKKKKKLISIPDYFLYEVYSSHHPTKGAIHYKDISFFYE